MHLQQLFSGYLWEMFHHSTAENTDQTALKKNVIWSKTVVNKRCAQTKKLC
jgi:hypothetical protein